MEFVNSSVAGELLVIGTGGLAKEMAQLARQIDEHSQRWHTISYVASERATIGTKLPYGEVRYVDDEVLARRDAVDVVLGIGYPPLRRTLAAKLIANRGLSFPNIVHPNVVVDQYVTLGRGNVIARGVVMTCDITVGDFNLFNLNVTVGHDVHVGSFNVMNPGTNISGSVIIGDECLLGTGCQVLERLELASSTIVGAGAVVTRTIATAGVYVGVPARARG
jgi:sugar O-acyltransferase (sialic acid O-acetyltransferase NeuD family)